MAFALGSATNRSPRQTRHLLFLAEFTSDIRHVKGTVNVEADALSRPAISSATTTVEQQFPRIAFGALALLQCSSDYKETSLVPKKVEWNGVEMLCDMSQGVLRPIVPLSFRRAIFDSLNALSHPGSKPSTRLVGDRFVRKGMRKDIKTGVLSVRIVKPPRSRDMSKLQS